MQLFLDKHLHIVTHDVPYPADFGGVIDIFYKIKWLHFVGIKIHLHCFLKNRPAQKELENYCETVTYYKRKGISSFSFSLPYIVSSRKSNLLLQNLQKDSHSILFEGIHSTYHLHKNEFTNRQIFLRLFNVEHIYYNYLASNETNFAKKIYYKNEARLLKKYEKSIVTKAHIFTLSTQDSGLYQKLFGAEKISFIPAFLPYDFIKSKTGKGLYCLYHANLGVNENENVALWLLQKVFVNLNIPFIIAGKNPSKKLQAAVLLNKNASIIPTPSEINLQLLIENAQINVLPSFNNTGVKLKLLNALYNGRHCLVNTAGVNGSGLNDLCILAETSEEFCKQIQILFTTDFTIKQMQHRSAALKVLYNNVQNAQVIHDAIQ